MSELDPQNKAPSEIAPSEIAHDGPQDEPVADPQNLINLDSETVNTKGTKDKKKKKKKDDKERDPEREKRKKDKKDKKLKIKGELFDDANVNDDGSVLKSVGGAQSILDEDDNIDAVIKNTK